MAESSPRLGFWVGARVTLMFRGSLLGFFGSLGAWFCLPNPTRMLKCCKIRYVLTFTNLISGDSQESSGRGVGRVRCDALRQSAEGGKYYRVDGYCTVPKIPTTLTLWLRSARPLSSNAPTSLVALLHGSTKRENSVTKTPTSM